MESTRIERAFSRCKREVLPLDDDPEMVGVGNSAIPASRFQNEHSSSELHPVKILSEYKDSNLGLLRPKRSALARLSYTPMFHLKTEPFFEVM